jgi:hypothetical protein
MREDNLKHKVVVFFSFIYNQQTPCYMVFFKKLTLTFDKKCYSFMEPQQSSQSQKIAFGPCYKPL